jgi:Mce-associated membrane protein
MLAITSPRNGYPVLRVSYTAVTTECDASDRVAAPASQRDVAGGRHRARLLVLLGLVLVVTIGGLAGWLGYRALHLTTIGYAHADSDLPSILDGATAKFRDDFPSDSQSLVVAVQFNLPPPGDPCLQGCI